MKKLILIGVVGLLLQGCGVAESLSNNCGGDLKSACTLFFGRPESNNTSVDDSQNAKINELKGLYDQLLAYFMANFGSTQDVLDNVLIRITELETHKNIVDLIDPCGDGPSYDEIVLQLSDGSLVAYFQKGKKRHLSVLSDGNYITTDAQKCKFSVVNGELVD